MSDVHLLQEVYRKDPWRLLTCCVMLNQTTRKQVDGVRAQFFAEYPTAARLARRFEFGEPWVPVADMIRPLGLQNRRAKTLIALAAWWSQREGWHARSVAEAVLELQPPGVGEYAADSYRIFVDGPTPENVAYALDRPEWPADKELQKWFGTVRAVGDSFLSREWAYEDMWSYMLDHPGGWTT